MLEKDCPGFARCDEAPDTLRDEALVRELAEACGRLVDDAAPDTPRRTPDDAIAFMGEGAAIDIHSARWDED